MRDQTLVNRLVELGQLTEAEAEDHPRKNELQQAIGGQPDVDPGVSRPDVARRLGADLLGRLDESHSVEGSGEDADERSGGVGGHRGAAVVEFGQPPGATDNATLVVIRAVNGVAV